MLCYRGTQRKSIKGLKGALSFTPSLPVAVIWSAVPGDFWARRKPKFLSTSTVHEVQIDSQNQLKLVDSDYIGSNYVSLADVLRSLSYGEPEGISESEVRKIYQYLHNRLIGKARGGEFLYKLFNEDGEEVDDSDVPFSLRSPITPISYYGFYEWENEPTLETASRLLADTFIFADSPAVQRAAKALGYESIAYVDVFAGGEQASEDLLGCPVEDLTGVEMETDLENSEVPTHWTMRPLDTSIIQNVESLPTAQVVETTDLCG